MECLLDALQSYARKLTNSKRIPKRKRKAVIHHSVQYVDAPAPRYIFIPHQSNCSSLELVILSVDDSEQFYTPRVGTSSWESMLGTIICPPEEASLLEDCDVLAFEGCNHEARVGFETDVLREEFTLERTSVWFPSGFSSSANRDSEACSISTAGGESPSPWIASLLTIFSPSSLLFAKRLVFIPQSQISFPFLIPWSSSLMSLFSSRISSTISCRTRRCWIISWVP